LRLQARISLNTCKPAFSTTIGMTARYVPLSVDGQLKIPFGQTFN
jgi:hypothetical protein